MPNKLKSKSQLRYMKAIEGGYVKNPSLSKAKAKEFTKDLTKKEYKKLPEFKGVKHMLKRK